MEDTKERKIFQIIVDDEEKRQIVLKNITKMLISRGVLHDPDYNKGKDKPQPETKKFLDYYQSLTKTGTDDLVYHINSTPRIDEKKIEKGKYNLETKVYGIKFITQKLTTINKASGITDFLNFYKDAHKIFVITTNTISQNAYYQLVVNQETEVLFEYELMVNLIDHIMVPYHQILTPEEAKEISESYIVKKKKMNGMKITEAVARYYNMQVGQIVRIVRDNKQSGKSPNYRIVKKANLFNK